MNHLKVRSCLIDGEVVCCDERGLARFDVLRRRRNEVDAFLYAFDLLELDGTDLRREPIETRKATLASVRAWSCSSMPARSAAKVSVTESATALAQQLLARYGVLTREVATAENIAGGFSAVAALWPRSR